MGVAAAGNSKGQTPNAKETRKEKTPPKVWLMVWYFIFWKMVRFLWPFGVL
jgi:hypothetical protein